MKATAVVDQADPSGLKVTLHVEWSSTHPSSLYDVDWGDGGPRDVGKDLDSLVHTYAKAGLYKVQVRENETSSTARAAVTVGTFPFGAAVRRGTTSWCARTWLRPARTQVSSAEATVPEHHCLDCDDLCPPWTNRCDPVRSTGARSC
jgi:hypothetical protein